MLDQWPVLGRDDDLDRVRRLWRSGPRSVVVAGPAGVGKTVFARACLELAPALGWETELLMAPGAAAYPSPGGGSLLATLLAELTDRPATTVLLVDDAHLLPDREAALLCDAAARGGVVVIATLRSETAAASAVTAMWKNDIAVRVELRPLTDDLVSRVLTTVLGGPVEHATTVALTERSEGNARYLRELVLGAVEDGTLVDAHGLWRLTGPLCPSARLVEIVTAELGDVSADHGRLLEVVAYAGTLAHPTLLRLTAADVLDHLERTGMLVTRRNGDEIDVGLRRVVHRDVLRARISPARSQAIAQELIQLSTAPDSATSSSDALQLAAWSLDAQTTTPAKLLAAANTARWRYDFPLAERLVTSAVLAGAGFEAELLAAQLAGLQGRNDDAERLFAGLYKRAASDAQRGQVAVSRLDNLGLYGGQIELGLRIAEEAEAAIEDRRWRDHVSGVKLALLLAAHGPRVAARAAEPLVNSATGLGLVRACGTAAFSFVRTGEIRKALDASSLGYAAHRDLDEPTSSYPWRHILTRCMALAQAGKFVEAENKAREQHSKGVADASPEAQAFFAWHLVRVVGERGHIHDATHYGREAVGLFRELGRRQYAREAQIALALALALAGRGAEAEALLRDLDTLDLPQTPYTVVDQSIAQGWTHTALGDLPRAIDTFQAGADLGTEIGDLAGATSALHAIARLGRAPDIVDQLTEISAVVEGDLAPARLQHVRALCTKAPEDLLAVSHTFEAMGADLLAAESAADHAEALLRAGHRRDSNAAQRRARDLERRCSGASTPGLRRLEIHASLTQSEFEIALLAANGATNTAIADKLKLSIRTVQNHLQRAYEKLGIHNRGELPDALTGGSPR